VTTLAAAPAPAHPRIAPDPTVSRRLWPLDVVRGVAILLVLGAHLPRQSVATVGHHGLLEPWHRVGWAGVDLFFVLSGYLIARLLLDELDRTDTIAVGRFLWRRAWRLYPAYWALLAVTLAWVQPTVPDVAAQLVFLQNYRLNPDLWRHTWSLAVEEHVYALLPLALLLARRSPRVGIGLAAAALAGPLWARSAALAGVPAGPVPLYGHLLSTHLRLDDPTVGVLLAWGQHHHRAAMARWRTRWLPGRTLLWASLLCLAPLVAWGPTDRAMVSWGLSCLAVGFGGVVWWALTQPPSEPGRGARALAACGVAAYSLYLWHWPVREALPLLYASLGWTVPRSTQYAVYLATSLTVGFGMARLLETPVLALRDRRWPAPAARRQARRQ
jgi:peptidoglycan/LPS O-acetylase OafA/YrhL